MANAQSHYLAYRPMLLCLFGPQSPHSCAGRLGPCWKLRRAGYLTASTCVRIRSPPGGITSPGAVSLPPRYFRARWPPVPFGTVSCSLLSSIERHAAFCSGQVGWILVALAGRCSFRRRTLCTSMQAIFRLITTTSSPVKMGQFRHLTPCTIRGGMSGQRAG